MTFRERQTRASHQVKLNFELLTAVDMVILPRIF